MEIFPSELFAIEPCNIELGGNGLCHIELWHMDQSYGIFKCATVIYVTLSDVTLSSATLSCVTLSYATLTYVTSSNVLRHQ